MAVLGCYGDSVTILVLWFQFIFNHNKIPDELRGRSCCWHHGEVLG